MPAPTHVTGVKRLLGMYSYYRKFIAQPITKSTRSHVPFEWTEEEQLLFFQSFRSVKIKTVAGKAGIAGMLFKFQNRDWKTVQTLHLM